jgi:DNA-3-methyladenine glycosylase II
VKGNILTDSSVEKSVKIISRIIGADQIPNKFYEMAHEDPLLRPLVDRFKGLHIPQSETVFEALILSILGQQISTQVAAILRAELIMNYGESIEVDGSIQYAFPTPEILSHVSVQELRQHKLSARKAEYIRQIALMESRGIIELESFRSMDADEATRQLVDLKGVGNWTAHWLLVRALSFNDGFPSGDLALQKYMGHLINDGKIMDDRQLLRYSERWMPYRSWVTTYMFADIRELPQNT